MDALTKLLTGFRRIAGDGDDPEIPEHLRIKGALVEMREERIAFQDEQRAWKTENDNQVETARAERIELRTDINANFAEIAALKAQFEADQKQRHKMRRLAVWFVRWVTKKDDNLSVAFGKITAVIVFLFSTSIAVYHGLKWTVIHLWKFFHAAI